MKETRNVSRDIDYRLVELVVIPRIESTSTRRGRRYFGMQINFKSWATSNMQRSSTQPIPKA